MDLKYIILMGEVLLLALVISSSSARKKKSLSSKPHVSHVTSKPTTINSLTNTNTASNIKLEQNVKKLAKRHRTIKDIRKLIEKRKLIRNPRKRKRVLKKLRKELATLKRKARSRMKKCKSSKDCALNECCIKKFSLKGHGRCRKRPKLKQRCRPALLPGLDIQCPCRYGLTCSPFKLSQRGFYKFRCERVKSSATDDELDPQAITGLGRFK